MVSIATFKSYFIEHCVHFVNYDPIYSKTEDKAGYYLGQDNLVINKLLLSV